MKMRTIFQLSWCTHRRQKRIFAQSFLLYLMMLFFFPLVWPNDPKFLNTIFPGLFWIAILFSFFLTSDHLFTTDREDGVLEQWCLIPKGLERWVSVTLFYHWLLQLIPILLSLPFIMVLFHLPIRMIGGIVLDVVVTTPALMMGCALSATSIGGLSEKGGLMLLLMFPLLLPVLIFGSGVLSCLMLGIPISGMIALLFAFSLMTCFLFPFLIVFFLKDT